MQTLLTLTVGIFQLEIGAESNIIKRNREQYIEPKNRLRVAIAGDAPKGIATIREYARKFNVIIIDSWTKLDVDSAEFDRLRKSVECDRRYPTLLNLSNSALK